MSAKLFQHCAKAYAFMDAAAEVGEDSGIKYATVRGTDIVKIHLGLSHSYYTPIFRTLENMGCIQNVEVGSGQRPSIWKLLKEPTHGDFLDAVNNGQVKGTNGDPSYIAANLNELRKRTTDLEGDTGAMKNIIGFFSKALEDLSARVDKLEGVNSEN